MAKQTMQSRVSICIRLLIKNGCIYRLRNKCNATEIMFYIRRCFVLVDCPHPTWHGKGFCVEGSCVYKKGWKGDDYSELDVSASVPRGLLWTWNI